MNPFDSIKCMIDIYIGRKYYFKMKYKKIQAIAPEKKNCSLNFVMQNPIIIRLPTENIPDHSDDHKKYSRLAGN